MKKQMLFLMMAGFLWNTVANGAPVVDGTLDTGIYGSAIAIQTVGTQFGDNASELDAAYATVVSNKLYLMLTGNLENNFNKLEIFIDSTDAVTTNVLDMAGNDGTDALDGLVFDTGFSPDYNFHIRHGGTDFYIDFSDLASSVVAEYGPFFGGSSEGSALTGTSAVNASVIGVGFNNSNTAGIGSGTNAADQAAATNVLTGLELCIDLADIGNPDQTIRIAALINSSANDYLSNQMLGGLPAGTDNLGTPNAIDLNSFSGDQFFTVNVPAELTCELSDSMGGSMDVGETNRISITISNLQGIASNITSTLTSSPVSGLSVISSNTPTGPLGSGGSLIHTYDVVADTVSNYVLTARASAYGSITSTSTFALAVGQPVFPSVSDDSLTLRVAPGQTGYGSVTLTNGGNASTPFTVTTDGRLPVFYTVETQSVSRISFWPADVQPDTVFNSWTGTDSDPLDIEFGFTLFGTEYTSFSVSQYGFLTLSETNGATARLAPFQTTTALDQSTIRYDRVGNEQLVIAWGNDTGQEFQLRLHSNGTVDYLYEFGTWGNGEIGLSAGTVSQTLSHVPGQTGNDALHLAPETWVSFTPDSGTLSVDSTRLLTFTADATAIQSPATYEFTTTVDWGSTSNEIDVTVIVENPYVQLDAPGTFTFSGLAGFISSPAILTVTNSGNIPLTYTITDSGLADAGYTSETVDYQWRHIPETLNTVLDESELNTTPVAIGFPFVFYGRTRTNLTVWRDGTLMFEDGAYMDPYSPLLSLDGNAQIRMLTDASLDRFTVTWENMAEPGSGEEDQTFQVVINRDGTFRYNYQQLAGRTPFDEVLSVEEIPIIETTYVTNKIGNYVQILEVETVVGTNTVTTYNEDFDRRSFKFTPGQSRIITFSPPSGTIPTGGTADITLRGDARSLTGDGTNDVSTGTTLTFNYGSTNASVDVTFTATNSVETAYPSAAAAEAMWGADEPVVSSQQNPDGSHTLSWPAPWDDLSRTYAVWYTTSLSDPWTLLDTVKNATSYVDDQHNDEPVIFYKVTVQ